MLALRSFFETEAHKSAVSGRAPSEEREMPQLWAALRSEQGRVWAFIKQCNLPTINFKVPIDQGTYGAVYCNNEVCVKSKPYSTDVSGLALVTEAFMQQVVHTLYPPASPSAYVCKVDTQRLGVVMPRLSKSLYEYVRYGGRHPLDAVAQVAFALHMLRTHDRVDFIAHRDLHVKNVMGKQLPARTRMAMRIGRSAIEFDAEWQWQIIDWGMGCMKVDGVELATNEVHFFTHPDTACNSAIDLTVLMRNLLGMRSTQKFASKFFTQREIKFIEDNRGTPEAEHFGYYFPQDRITPAMVFMELSKLARYQPRVATPPTQVTVRKRARSPSPAARDRKRVARELFG